MAGFVLLFACQRAPEAPQAKASGEALAKVYCASCHLCPKPSDLDYKSWQQHILPRMGQMLGIYQTPEERQRLLGSAAERAVVEQSGLYPEKARIGSEEWQAIQAFYLENAPKQLTDTVTRQWPTTNFALSIQPPGIQLAPPSTTLTHFTKDGRLFIGDAHTKALYTFDQKGAFQGAANVREGAVWMEEKEQHYLLTVMGSFSPTDQASGLLLALPKDATSKTRILLKDLQRPVHHASADLNQDGLEDLVICEFAKWTGGLAWWQQLPSGAYQKHVLRQRPGATKCYIRDLNQDERPDLIALFGQGDEGIFAYLNKGNGQFEERVLLRFPPSYGSSYFQLFDHNDDGRIDLLYTAGDNADFPPILKPYHGIRIFEQRDDLQFQEVFFQPMNGAYNAQAADLDLDGDLDIAAISFFPNWEDKDEQSLLILENTGSGKYTPSKLALPAGRWIVMDQGDPDKDGDVALVLGSLAFEVPGRSDLVNQWAEGGVPYILIENQAADNQKK